MLAHRYSSFKRYTDKFCKLTDIRQLQTILKMPLYQLQLIGQSPPYNHFTIKKKNGGLREIEAPAKNLKDIQDILNDYLQSVYWFHKTEAAYGFILNLKNDKNPRNIKTNGEKHIGCKYLLNVDLKDFFHQVNWSMILDVYMKPPFNFKFELAELLTNLTTYNGRLPMGTPTSPVLSNFASIQLDNDLLALARNENLMFTRYADDLSFSSNSMITRDHFIAIEELLKKHHFEINQEKVKFYEVNDAKEVTGLIIGEKRVLLPQNYFDELSSWLDKLKTVIEIKCLSGNFKQHEKWLKKFLQQIEGKLQFIAMIYGDDSEKYLQWFDKYQEALEPSDNIGGFESSSWLKFPY